MQKLAELLILLAKSDLDFVVIGGYAAVAHGSAYMTTDIDICADLSPEVLAKLRETLAPIRPIHRMTSAKLSFAEHPQSTVGLKNLYLATDYGVLDIISEVEGVGGLAQLKERAVESSADGHPVKVISLQDLITAKEKVGREKDKLVAKELRGIQARLNRNA